MSRLTSTGACWNRRLPIATGCGLRWRLLKLREIREQVVMKKSFSTALLFLLLITLSGLAGTQPDDRAPSKNRCDQFKLRVIEPADAERYKMQVVKPDDRVDYKGIVIDPCAAPTPNVSRIERTTPLIPKPFRPATPPAKPSNELFKAPSELFKPFAPFKTPERK